MSVIIKKYSFVILLIFFSLSILRPNQQIVEKQNFTFNSSFQSIDSFFIQKMAAKTTTKISPMKISGIVLSAVGGTFIASGVAILLYDLLWQVRVVEGKIAADLSDSSAYAEYQVAYYVLLGLLSGSIAGMIIGIGMLIGGLSNLLYKGDNAKVSFNLDVKDDLSMAFSLNF